MSRLFAALYDRLTLPSEVACLQGWRSELLRGLQGTVLEVGAGTGLNVPHYPAGLSRLVLSEPDPHMRRQLERRTRDYAQSPTELLTASLVALPLADESFDAVVGTLVLCSVPKVEVALAEILRVLKPGGHFVFLEHVAAEQRPSRLRWQRVVEPVWKRIAGNCHLTRRTEAAIRASGFDGVECRRESMRKAMPLVRPTIRGYALKPRPSVG